MSLRLAVMISGGGTNLQSIIDASEENSIQSKIEIIISNNKNAYGLTRGKKHGIDSIYLSEKEFNNKEEYEKELLKILEKKEIDLIVLAGYLSKIPLNIVKKYRNKIVNIHPSLIPSFCGKGFYGIKVHEKALEYGVKVTGATTHFVDENFDTGGIILQKPVIVKEKIVASELQKEVLKIEHEILVETIKLIEEEKLKIAGRNISYK